MNFVLLRSDQIDGVWPQLAEGMAESCKATGGNMTAGWLWQECRSGHAFLIIGHEADAVKVGLVVQFQTLGGEPILRGLGLCGQGFRDWAIGLADFLRQIAKSGGAQWFIDDGRPGMSRLVPGAEVVSITYRVKV